MQAWCERDPLRSHGNTRPVRQSESKAFWLAQVVRTASVGYPTNAHSGNYECNRNFPSINMKFEDHDCSSELLTLVYIILLSHDRKPPTRHKTCLARATARRHLWIDDA